MRVCACACLSVSVCLVCGAGVPPCLSVLCVWCWPCLSVLCVLVLVSLRVCLSCVLVLVSLRVCPRACDFR
jgi:hypothetical protein